jgi:hypothetical protein
MIKTYSPASTTLSFQLNHLEKLFAAWAVAESPTYQFATQDYEGPPDELKELGQ